MAQKFKAAYWGLVRNEGVANCKRYRAPPTPLGCAEILRGPHSGLEGGEGGGSKGDWDDRKKGSPAPCSQALKLWKSWNFIVDGEAEVEGRKWSAKTSGGGSKCPEAGPASANILPYSLLVGSHNMGDLVSRLILGLIRVTVCVRGGYYPTY